MRARARFTLVAAAAVAAACSPGQPATADHDPAPYLSDLDQLERFVATTYAHFEWAAGEGGIDPPALDRRARAAIRASRSHEEAVAALEQLVAGFGDGHFRLRQRAAAPAPEPGGDRGVGPWRGTTGSEACAELGYEEHDKSFRIDFGKGFELLTDVDDPFPAGRLELAGGRRIGILRIDEFGANRYAEYCPETWERYRQGLAGPCADARCRRRFRFTVEDRLLVEIARRVDLLRAAGIDALLVDITTNGGGHDWYDPAARMLTARPLAGNPSSFVRHAHWRGMLEEMRAEVAADLARADLVPAQRAMLEEILARLDFGIAETRRPCDLSLLWRRRVAELPCSLLVRGVTYSTGLLREPPSVDVAGLEIASSLFEPLQWEPQPTVWDGPLAVLVNHDTASAAAAFSTLLRDNGAATLIGKESSHGTGCGYTNGGIQERLEHSGLEVWVSDCVRHRRDGGSEQAGLFPDLAVPWEWGDSPALLGRKLVDTLERWHAPSPGAETAGGATP